MTDEKPVPVPEELENILLDFTVNVLVQKPDDLIGHAAAYFSRLKRERDNTSTEEVAAAAEFPQIPLGQSISQMLGNRDRRRTAVVGEVFDPEENETEVEIHPKSKEEKDRIKKLTEDIFLFKHLSKEDLDAIIDAMIPTEVQTGQVIIKQNEEGDFFYVVDKGQFDTFIETDGEEKFVTSYKDSGSFGELSLLHNQPRAATIKAATDGSLWAVSRSTFTRLVVKNAYEKRKRYIQLLDKVPELQPLTEYDKMQVSDALSPVFLKKDELLFSEGEEGKGMYFIEKGSIGIYKDGKEGSEELAQLEAGDYLGEMAVVKKQPRAGSAKALEDSQLAFLDVDAFERLLGPCVDVMKKRMDAYKNTKNE